MENQEIDRSKLKSFRDITNIQSRTCYMRTRRQWTTELPTHYVVRRNPNSNETHSLPIPDRPKTPVFHTYNCQRKKSINIKGKKILFYFKDGNNILFTAKFKPSSTYIPIMAGDDVHIKSDNNDAVLLYANNFCDFSLRKKTNYGPEIMSIQFRIYENEARQPRRLSLFFFERQDDIPEKLDSVEPDQTDEMTWCVDLNTEDAVTSIKNCRIEDQNHNLYEIVRKKKDDVLEVEARDTIDKLCLFTTAIASFLCKR